MRSERFSRRALLRGLGASGAMIPLLNADFARGQTPTAPKRLVTVAWGHGICPPLFWSAGDKITISATSSPTLSSFSTLIPKMLMVAALDMKPYMDHGGTFDGHNGYPGLFTGTTKTSPGKSIEVAVGDELAAKGLKKAALQVALGVEPDGNTISYRGGGQKNIPETDPWKFFTNVFAGASLPPDQLAKLRAHRKSMLDYLGKDITDFGTRLGTEDRMKIQAHMQSIRDLESALAADAATPAKACAMPSIGSSRSLDTQTHTTLMFQVLAAALRCDLTRTASMTVKDDHGRYNVRFPWLDVADDYHPLAHQSKPGYAKKVIIDTWLFSKLAEFVKDLDGSPEANGKTTLDNSVVVWSSDMNEGSFHFVGGLPFLLIGSCGGAIKTDGRVLRLGNYVGKDAGTFTSASGVPHNKLLATLWNAMGLTHIDGFGDPAYSGTLDSDVLA